MKSKYVRSKNEREMEFLFTVFSFVTLFIRKRNFVNLKKIASFFYRPNRVFFRQIGRQAGGQPDG